MRYFQAIAEQIREIHDLWCKFRGNRDVDPAQDDRIDWLRDQQRLSQRRTGNWQSDRYRIVVDPREDRDHD